jgi:hydrogenase-4 component B
MSGALFAVAIGCFLLGGVIDLAFGMASPWVRPLPYFLALVGSVCLFILGVHATTTSAVSVNLNQLFEVGHGALQIDQLAGLFLTLLFGISVAVSACFISWARTHGPAHHRGVATGFVLLLGSVAVIICAADAFLFLFAWELLTLSFYLLTIASWHQVRPGVALDAAWVLVVVGFGAKLGLVPFQVWIPRGYPAAPGPARAAMAGIAANVAVYGLWRFMSVLGRPPVWLVIVVLVSGGVTALLGITFAGVQPGLARVIAYSSIENAGLIVTAYGIALTGDVVRMPALVAVGLLAATLQTVTHAVAKSALFVALANVEAREGTDDLDKLRGIGRRMRWSGATFGAGALTLAGLPPTIGFVSEWFILEALMQQFRVTGLALRLGLAGAAALVALTTGLAALVFLRVLALTFLGKPSPRLERQREVGLSNKIGLMVLAVACLAMAALSPLEVRFIADGLGPVVPRLVTMQALKSPWVLQPVFSGFSILSPSWLWVILPIAITSVFAVTMLLSRGKFLRIRRVPAWRSATSGVDGPSSYTAFGFANPLRRVLGNVLSTKRSVQINDSGVDDPDNQQVPHVESLTTVIEPVETYLYRPLRTGALVTARVAKRLQSGHLNAYVAYMLIALVAALAVVSAMH